MKKKTAKKRTKKPVIGGIYISVRLKPKTFFFRTQRQALAFLEDMKDLEPDAEYCVTPAGD